MYANKIPVKEYEKLAEEFNPTQYDAKAWVNCAKRAGMKYIVITANITMASPCIIHGQTRSISWMLLHSAGIR